MIVKSGADAFIHFLETFDKLKVFLSHHFRMLFFPPHYIAAEEEITQNIHLALPQLKHLG